MSVPTTYASNRREDLVAGAARCFERDGFGAASIRDIAAEVGMRTASIYYHFPSKDALLIAVHEEGLRRITEATSEAVAGIPDGWDRLAVACTAHLRTLLGGDPIFKAIMRPLPSNPQLRARITEMRDAYEEIFTAIITELPLSQDSDRRHLRLMVLGAMNWSFTWFSGDDRAIDAYALSIVSNLRTQLEPSN